jgi:hypothetical protein
MGAASIYCDPENDPKIKSAAYRVCMVDLVYRVYCVIGLLRYGGMEPISRLPLNFLMAGMVT